MIPDALLESVGYKNANSIVPCFVPPLHLHLISGPMAAKPKRRFEWATGLLSREIDSGLQICCPAAHQKQFSETFFSRRIVLRN